MGNLLLPLLPSNLQTPYCFTSWQSTLNDFANATKAVLPGSTFFNTGSTKPAPEFQGYYWLYEPTMTWYRYDGQWISPNPNLTGVHRWEEFAQESDVWSYDGGDGTDPSVNPPGNRTGAMWKVDHNYDGRCPMSPGSIPGLTVPQTLLPATNAGAAETVLVPANIDHWHGVGTDGAPGGNDPPIMISRAWGVSPTTFTQRLQDSPGTGTWGDGGLFSSGTMGSTGPIANTTAATPFPIIPPVRGMYCIVRTARVNYVIP